MFNLVYLRYDIFSPIEILSLVSVIASFIRETNNVINLYRRWKPQPKRLLWLCILTNIQKEFKNFFFQFHRYSSRGNKYIIIKCIIVVNEISLTGQLSAMRYNAKLLNHFEQSDFPQRIDLLAVLLGK